MAEPYPIELRQRVVESYEAGEGSYLTVAKKFHVVEVTVRRWVGHFRDVGHLKPQKKGGGWRSDISAGSWRPFSTSLAIPDLVRVARRARHKVRPRHIRHWFAHSGYSVQLK